MWIVGVLIVAVHLAFVTEYLIGRWTGETPPDEDERESDPS